jgi:DNA replication protein DnaC
MSFNKENYSRIRAEYDEKRNKAVQEANKREGYIYDTLKGIKLIDGKLRATGAKLLSVAMEGGENVAERIELIKKENLSLQAKRAEILRQNGYSADYTEPQYECKQCNDTGFIGDKICDCLKKALIMAQYQTSGIGYLMKSQSFKTFKLDYYKDGQHMQQVYDMCKSYAEQYDNSGKSLLLCGNTGLGKTHMSTSIAKIVIDKGYNVLYDTAQEIIGDFEQERFGSYGEDKPDLDKYFDCDLLIIDDLGTEVSNQFTVSCLYNIINTRLNKSKSTIINTNLNQNELPKRYGNRIASRIFGEYKPLVFIGNDIRMKKLEG